MIHALPFARTATLFATAVLLLSGCVVKETRPLPKLKAVQAQQQIPDDQLLDVAIREFDPGIPAKVEDEEELAKRRIYPDVRRAESRILPSNLRVTLEGTGQWGAVRVVPANVQFVDVLVTGRIVESTGFREHQAAHVESVGIGRVSQAVEHLDGFETTPHLGEAERQLATQARGGQAAAVGGAHHLESLAQILAVEQCLGQVVVAEAHAGTLRYEFAGTCVIQAPAGEASLLHAASGASGTSEAVGL